MAEDSRIPLYFEGITYDACERTGCSPCPTEIIRATSAGIFRHDPMAKGWPLSLLVGRISARLWLTIRTQWTLHRRISADLNPGRILSTAYRTIQGVFRSSRHHPDTRIHPYDRIAVQ